MIQAYRTRTFESEFCMGGQTRIGNLPYKFLIPVFGLFFFFFFFYKLFPIGALMLL